MRCNQNHRVKKINNLYTYRLRTAWIETKSAGTLKASKNISAALSLFFRGLRGASVSSTGCCKESMGQYLNLFLISQISKDIIANIKCNSISKVLMQQHHIIRNNYLFGKGLKLVFAINVLPYALHIIPVCDNAMFHWVAVKGVFYTTRVRRLTTKERFKTLCQEIIFNYMPLPLYKPKYVIISKSYSPNS